MKKEDKKEEAGGLLGVYRQSFNPIKWEYTPVDAQGSSGMGVMQCYTSTIPSQAQSFNMGTLHQGLGKIQ